MYKIFSIAFYNLENLFDTVHDAYTLDEDYTPEGEYQWNQDRYNRKIRNLANVISKIGRKQCELPPVFVGVSEVENDTCLEDLINDEKLKPFQYDFVHYDSPDERGIDVAFLYQKKHFELTYSDNYPLMLIDDAGDRDYTRDILLVHGKLFGKPVYVIVNHWPSRNKGANASSYKRVQAAKLVNEIINDIYKENENARIIIMGDFNDDPNSNSIKNNLMSDSFFNPMLEMQQNKMGSVRYSNKWFMFDQIIMSDNLLSNESNQLKFISTDIFNDHFLQEPKGKRRGAPKRTFIGKWHLGGYSDHFPVLAYFKII
jgi:predicted extracellular nuclease